MRLSDGKSGRRFHKKGPPTKDEIIRDLTKVILRQDEIIAEIKAERTTDERD